MEAKVVNVVVGKENMIAIMKKEIFMDINMVVVVSILEIIVDNNNQVMDPQHEAVWVEEAQATPMVVVMDLLVEIGDMLAEDFKNSRKNSKVLSRKKQGVVSKAVGNFETVVPNALQMQSKTLPQFKEEILLVQGFHRHSLWKKYFY